MAERITVIRKQRALGPDMVVSSALGLPRLSSGFERGESLGPLRTERVKEVIEVGGSTAVQGVAHGSTPAAEVAPQAVELQAVESQTPGGEQHEPTQTHEQRVA